MRIDNGSHSQSIRIDLFQALSSKHNPYNLGVRLGVMGLTNSSKKTHFFPVLRTAPMPETALHKRTPQTFQFLFANSAVHSLLVVVSSCQQQRAAATRRYQQLSTVPGNETAEETKPHQLLHLTFPEEGNWESSHLYRFPRVLDLHSPVCSAQRPWVAAII